MSFDNFGIVLMTSAKFPTKVAPMPNREATWNTVWAKVRARQEELRWTDAQLQEACDISETTYRNYRRDGTPLVRPPKVARLEHGLGWVSGSVAAILAGGEPVELAAKPGGDVSPLGDAQMEARLRAEIAAGDARIDARIRAVENEVHKQLETMVEQLEEMALRLERGRRKSE